MHQALWQLINAAALPVLDHLPTLPLPQDAAAAHTLGLLTGGSRFNWRQSYDENDFSRHFLNNYGWVMLAGEMAG